MESAPVPLQPEIQQPDPGPKLVDRLLEAALSAFDPTQNAASRAAGESAFNSLIEETSPLSLLPALNALIKPDQPRVSPPVRARLLDELVVLPMRRAPSPPPASASASAPPPASSISGGPTPAFGGGGVRATLEFVFAVHPSSTVTKAEAATPQRRGAFITMEALQLATKLLASPPAAPRLGVTPDAWFAAVGPQLLALLDGADGDELVRVAAYVVGFGVLGRKQFGAPGTPGWRTFAEPMLTPINPSLAASAQELLARRPESDVVDLSSGRVLVDSEQMELTLHRLSSLLNSHPNPGLTKRLLHPVFLSLWSLSSWTEAEEHVRAKLCVPARKLLEVYLRLVDSKVAVDEMIRNLLYKGGKVRDGSRWAFQEAKSHRIHVVSLPESTLEFSLEELNLEESNSKSDALVDLIKSVCTDDDVSSIFLGLLRRWFEANTKSRSTIIVEEDDPDVSLAIAKVHELQMLQKFMDKLGEKLAGRSDHMLELVNQMMAGSLEDDAVIEVSLSLLNLVVTSTHFRVSTVNENLLQNIKSSLASITAAQQPDISSTARNLSNLLEWKDALHEADEQPTVVPTDRQVEDRKTYNLAMSYITQPDSPPPVRSEGMNLISGLIVSNSPVLDIPAVVVLLSSLIEEDDDYINLRVVKMFTQFANRHPKTVTQELVDRYIDPDEKASVDSRLRFGEALLQVIERLGETFTDAVAGPVCEALLATAGRRGHRPETLKRQEREARLEKARKKEADDAWGGEVPDMTDEREERERARDYAIQALVQGWESRRGEEDVRIRASALSVLRAAIETNVAGVGAHLVAAAVDLCVAVLTVEPEPEKGILRRAAVTVVLAFVLALNRAREQGVELGFGLTPESRDEVARVLEYAARTDNDGLVRQHARDALESLENWSLVQLIPRSQPSSVAGTTLTRLAGLAVDPESSSSLQANKRPRIIEEIE